jgi:hypothetical protein
MDGCHGILASHGKDRSRIAQPQITIYSCITLTRFFLAEGAATPDGAVDRRKDWQWHRAKSKTRWFRRRLLVDLRAEPFDQLRVVLTVAGNSLASYRTITCE